VSRASIIQPSGGFFRRLQSNGELFRVKAEATGAREGLSSAAKE
jgi:hypothetical protein